MLIHRIIVGLAGHEIPSSKTTTGYAYKSCPGTSHTVSANGEGARRAHITKAHQFTVKAKRA